MRGLVNKQRLLTLFAELGRAFPHPARLYLTGSAALVMEGVRESVDVDYFCQVSSELEGKFTSVVREVKERLQISLELISPADFIPLPEGWEGRCRFLERYDSIDVYLFDPYSIALTKLLRGTNSDLNDVATQLRGGALEHARLEGFVEWLAGRWSLSGWHREGDPDKLRERLRYGLKTAGRLADPETCPTAFPSSD